ncbi:GFA family protein [Arenimonas sp.]|uniref:GFA family protein n=1 Tax=Arenimonas sp. TaxID=1872635 RepID=UPI0039E40B2D
MNAGNESFAEGGCTCRTVRYRIQGTPMIVHACHCSWCQRETGTAFALNAIIEADRVALLQGEVEVIDTPSASGRGQKIARCPQCRVALWSNYPTGGPGIRFVRVGSLDEPGAFLPDAHIYASTKQPWLVLPADGAPVFDEFYDPRVVWPQECRDRYVAAQKAAASA